MFEPEKLNIPIRSHLQPGGLLTIKSEKQVQIRDKMFSIDLMMFRFIKYMIPAMIKALIAVIVLTYKFFIYDI